MQMWRLCANFITASISPVWQGCSLGLDVLVSRWSRDVSRDISVSRFSLISMKIVNVSVSATNLSLGH